MKNIKAAEAQTASNNVIQLNVMLNYGARREIIDAVVSYAQDGGALDELSEDVFSSHLYTSGIPDPDVLIRTGGDIRLSNFLLWQCAYSELFS